LTLLVGASVGCSAPEATDPEPTDTVASALNGTTWNLIWHDEFDGSTYDRGNWVASNNTNCVNSEAQSYKDSEGCGAGTSTICQYNGYLHLIARYSPNASNGCGYTTNYVSSRLTTKTKFHMNPGMGNQGIRIEGRINFPQMTTGVFPAFWMLGADVAEWPSPGSTIWPQAGEMDISEWGSAWSANQSLSTAHYSTQDPVTYNGQYHAQIGSFYSAGAAPDAWHTYAVEWTWSSIKWFFDGSQVGPTIDLNATPSQDFNHDFAIILNNAVGGPGGGYAGIDPALVPQSTSTAGSGFDSHQRMAVDYVRVYALNNDNGWYKRTFQGTGQYDAAVPIEWDTGSYKADCGYAAAMTGLSANPSGGTPRSQLCTNYGTQFSDNGVATLTDVAWGEHRRATRDVYVVGQTDWDVGYYKSECGLNEYVSGVSQTPGGNIHGLRCSSAGMTNSGKNGCETHLVTQEDRGYAGSGDWDVGYYKSECSWGKTVVGVSASTSTGKPHKILCCSN
jgi:beta-glucanase (GH16 family)